MGWIVALVLGLGTGCTPAPVEEAVVPSELDATEHAEAIGDLQHLLGEAVGAAGAGDRVLAEQRWDAAYTLMKRHLLPTLRAKDPQLAFELSYRMGRLRNALVARRGRTAEPYAWVDGQLNALRMAAVSEVQVP